MSVTFEEMADAGLPTAGEIPPQKPHRRWRVLIVILLLLASGVGAWKYFESQAGSKLPAAAELLLVEEGELPADGVLPHRLDDATEFPGSLVHLKEGVAVPNVREAQSREQSLGLIASQAQVLPESAKQRWPESLQPDDIRLVVEMPEVRQEAVEPSVASVFDPIVVDIGDLPQVDVELGQLAVRDWEGLILVPDDVKLSRAFSTTVRLSRIEAHPIDGGRLRVWVRIENLIKEDLGIRIGCSFYSPDDQGLGAGFEKFEIPTGAAVDAFFVSSTDGVRAYTILVKRLGSHS